ncbi:hypothetical protein SEPCBS119000_006605 [Sporothrix epigloea]|uniref:Uncharacterized protein n=1 Tax=Sporothrix epigloea TaxID=1892477 RepID=A0ABP0E5S2_9PEZI
MSAKLDSSVTTQLMQGRKRFKDDNYVTTKPVGSGSTGNISTAINNSLLLTDNASLSDNTSPATPTFSNRSGLGHSRYSSSTSSLDLPLSLSSPSYSECSTPSPVTGLTATVCTPNVASLAAAAVKRPLPDVQEEDLLEHVAEDEHQFGDSLLISHRDSYLYGCLCDEPCDHGREGAAYERSSYDYDPGFVSDCEPAGRAPSVQRHRHRTGSSMSAISNGSSATSDSAFSGLTLRFGSHIHALSRWRSRSSTRRRTYGNLVGAPASDPSLSRALSSRSSSLSAGRPAPNVYPGPINSPASSSYYGSTESFTHVPTATMLDADSPNQAHNDRGRDHSKSSTPLLPPMLINDNDVQQQPVSPLPPPSLQTSPRQPAAEVFLSTQPGPAHTLAGSELFSDPDADIAVPSMSPSIATIGSGTAATMLSLSNELQSSPLLHHKYSMAMLSTSTGTSTPPITAAATSTIPSALEPQDEWCDRLGHANYTIFPKPYGLPKTDSTNTQALILLRNDWMLARTNYAKHLVRTGEHYGTTSNTYALTVAKWAETDRVWQFAHDEAMAHITDMLVRSGADGHARAASLDQLPPLQHHNVSCVIPQILDKAEGKFPVLGDEDIVGPMDRVAFMEREDGGFVATAGMHREKNGMTRFLRGLADRMRSRR